MSPLYFEIPRVRESSLKSCFRSFFKDWALAFPLLFQAERECVRHSI